MTAEIIDQACALEEMMREHAIQAHRIDHSAVSAEHCGEDIPAPRSTAVPGCQTCAECQGVIEFRNKLRGS